MTKHKTLKELDAIATVSPDAPGLPGIGPLPPMTRTEKLERWSDLILKTPLEIFVFHGIEYMDDVQLERCTVLPYDARLIYRYTTPFQIAFEHEPFRDAGLTGASALDAKRFFALSQPELHEFSCDCGGPINRVEMARRVRGIARGEPSRHSRPSSVTYANLARDPEPTSIRWYHNIRGAYPSWSNT